MLFHFLKEIFNKKRKNTKNDDILARRRKSNVYKPMRQIHKFYPNHNLTHTNPQPHLKP